MVINLRVVVGCDWSAVVSTDYSRGKRDDQKQLGDVQWKKRGEKQGGAHGTKRE